ncbi:MAG: glycoside hydrolase family 29 [Planctomycetes bacterium]|nr:glycoside hydrolase family 29 [Planctomycetota bacterium]
MFQPTRRQMLHVASAAAALPLLASTAIRSAVRAAAPLPAKRPVPTPAQLRWQDCEFGVICHLDMPIVAAHPVPTNNLTKKTYDPQLYNPAQLDTDQWVAAAKAAGAKYAVFTATHFNGFMQWQSDAYPYGLKQAAWRNGKGDIVGDFVESCHKADILPGIYMSTNNNAYQTVWRHFVKWGKGKSTPEQAAYNRIAEQQVTELCSRYGKLIQIWFDSATMTPKQDGADVLPIFEKHQPDSVFYASQQRADHRWIGNEDAVAGDPCWATMPGFDCGPVGHGSNGWRKYLAGGDPDGTYWSPGMADTVLRGRGVHDWLWTGGHENNLVSVDQLMRMYDTSVGRNCNFLLGLVIDPTGLVPAADVARMEEFGKALRNRFSNPAGQTSGSGNNVTLRFDAPRTIDQIVLQEDIARGERVRKYTVEVHTGADQWTQLFDAQSIGHKRIVRFDPVEAAAVRLTVSASVAEPIIKNFAAYGVA